MVTKEINLSQLEKDSEHPDFWNDSTAAQRVMKNISSLRDDVEGWRAFNQRLNDLTDLAKMDDESLRPELESEISQLEADLEKRSFAAMLSGKYDEDSALLAIHAGAGGTDSQDWAAMLQRMYLRWAERRGFETEILDLTEGEEAGTKSITIAVNGRYAYGYLRSEKGEIGRASCRERV